MTIWVSLDHGERFLRYFYEKHIDWKCSQVFNFLLYANQIKHLIFCGMFECQIFANFSSIIFFTILVVTSYCPLNLFEIVHNLIMIFRCNYFYFIFYFFVFIRFNIFKLLKIKDLNLVFLKVYAFYILVDLHSLIIFRFVQLCIWSNQYLLSLGMGIIIVLVFLINLASHPLIK